jgi:hypothetical protein
MENKTMKVKKYLTYFSPQITTARFAMKAFAEEKGIRWQFK